MEMDPRIDRGRVQRVVIPGAESSSGSKLIRMKLIPITKLCSEIELAWALTEATEDTENPSVIL